MGAIKQFHSDKRLVVLDRLRVPVLEHQKANVLLYQRTPLNVDTLQLFIVRIPVRFHRRNGRQMVLTHGGSNGQATPERESNGSLVSALAKAYRWQEQLESGEYASLEDLATANSVDCTYVGRILRLTSLAPDIVERILRGDEPEGISLRGLQKNLPLVWARQTCG